MVLFNALMLPFINLEIWCSNLGTTYIDTKYYQETTSRVGNIFGPRAVLKVFLALRATPYKQTTQESFIFV